MGCKKDMERCIAYIKNNRDRDISPKEMAEEMGYSYNYFCSIFSLTTGMPIGEYIRKQRIEAAARDIVHGRSIADAAKNRGFHTLSGFNKAFKRWYDMSPREFKAENQLITGPEIITHNTIKAVGYAIRPHNGREWNPYHKAQLWGGVNLDEVGYEAYRKLAAAGKGEIGFWYNPEEESGSRTYFFGPIVKDFSSVPPGMTTISLPPITYAVFTTVPVNIHGNKGGFRRTLDSVWQYIMIEWFDKDKEWEVAQDNIPFEFYPHHNQSTKSDKPVQIYIPLNYKED